MNFLRQPLALSEQTTNLAQPREKPKSSPIQGNT